MRLWPFLALLVFLVPTSNASFTDSREWSAFAVSFTDTDGVVAATSFTLNSAPHGFSVASRTTSLQWTAQLTTTPANAATIDEYSMTLIIKEGATTRITCGGVSFSRVAVPDLGRFQTTFLSFCQGTGSNALVPGTTYTYETTATMVSGTNHIVQSGQSIKLQQTDSVTDATLDPLATQAALVYRTNQTNSYINATQTAVLAGIQHLDAHFVQTNGYINASVGTNFSSVINFVHFRTNQTNSYVNQTLFQGENQTVLGMSALPGMTGSDTTLLLLNFALLIWAFYDRRWLIAVVATIAIGIVFIVGQEFAIAAEAFMLLAVFWLEFLASHKADADNAEQSEE